ncbi:MAG TPA: cytochrome P450 [Jatrophihabitantaceae bacterium]
MTFVHPFSPAGRADPYPGYRWLQQRAPVFHDPTTRMWLVTSHAGCTAVLKDPRFSAALGQQQRTRDDALPPSMLNTDPPEHNRLRAPGVVLLGPAAVRSIASDVAADIASVVAGLGGAVDAMRDVGAPVSTAVFARLFGLRAADRDPFTALAHRASVNLDPLVDPGQAAEGRRAMAELSAFLDRHVDGALDSPLTRLMNDGRLTRAETLGILNLTVVGGWQPLAELVGNALYWLLPRPDALARLRAADETLARTAVDELLRLEAPIPFTARVTTAPVDLDGVTVPAGARVLAIIAAANRDPAVFAAADDLRLDRSPNPHLAFGGGGHFCLGAALVRSVGALLLPALLRAFPHLRGLLDDPTWETSLVPRRLRELPIALDGVLDGVLDGGLRHAG